MYYIINVVYQCILIHSCVQLAPWSPPPISVVIIVHGNIQGKVVQCLAGSFWTRDVEVTQLLLSEFPLPTGKAVDL